VLDEIRAVGRNYRVSLMSCTTLVSAGKAEADGCGQHAETALAVAS